MQIRLVAVVGSHLDVLPHMLSHYSRLGVDSLWINLHMNSYHDVLYYQALEIAEQFGAEIKSIYIGKWLQSVNPFLYAASREKHPNDWFLMADVDEFQVYPQELRSFFQRMDDAGYDYIEGCVIDRLARDGGFPAVDPHISIWSQFPIAGMITYPLLGANIQKIVAAKGCVSIGPGQHEAFGGHGCPRKKEYIPVHHFKWFQGLDLRLKARVEFYRANDEPIWIESQKFLDYWAEKPNVDLTDPRFFAAESTQEYPLWEEVKNLVFSLTPRAQECASLEVVNQKP